MAVGALATHDNHVEAERTGRFEHNTAGHVVEDAVINKLSNIFEDSEVSMKRASVARDENEGIDYYFGPHGQIYKFNLTTSRVSHDEKMEELDDLRKQNGGLVPAQYAFPVLINMEELIPGYYELKAEERLEAVQKKLKSDEDFPTKLTIRAIRGMGKSIRSVFTPKTGEVFFDSVIKVLPQQKLLAKVS